MKILITTDCYRPVINGVVTSVVNLAEGLEALGHEVQILTLANGPKSYREGNVTYLASFGAGGIYPDARVGMTYINRFVRELAGWQPDVVHSQCEFSTFLFAKWIAWKAGCPLIHTYHTVYEDFTHYFSPNVRLGKYLAAKFSKWICERAQAVVAPTEKTKNLLLGYGVETPVFTVPTGLDLRRFSAPANGEGRTALRRRLGIPKGAAVLVYVGRLAREKHIGELLSLVKTDIHQDLWLLMAGDGPQRADLEQMSRRLGIGERVIFTGMIQPSEIADYYRAGDVFVSASRSETQGLTYIEAMAGGLPLLCRDDACLAGVVRDGDNGFVYRTEQEFHDRLEVLLKEPELRMRMGRRAAQTVREQFSMETFTAGMEKLYFLCCDTGQGRAYIPQRRVLKHV